MAADDTTRSGNDDPVPDLGVEVLDATVGGAPTSPTPSEGLVSPRGLSTASIVLAVVSMAALFWLVASGRSGSDQAASPPSPSTTAAQPTRPFLSRTIDSAIVGDGPIFDQPVGWSIMTLTNDGLVAIDLDTGDATELESGLHPMLATDEHVVFGSAIDGVLFVAPITDLSDLNVVPGMFMAAPSSEPGRIWTISDQLTSAGAAEYVLVDLRTLEIVRRVVAGSLSTIFRSHRSSMFWLSPEIATPPEGGSYQLETDGSYTRFSDGSVLSHGFGVALVEECSTGGCEYLWFDAADKSLLQLTDPPQGEGPFVVAGGGRLLDLGPRPAVIDITTGMVLELAETFTPGLDGASERASMTLSPDGRIAAYRRAGVLELLDTASEVTRRFDALSPPIESDEPFPSVIFFSEAG